MIKALLNNIIGQNQNYSSYKMDSPKSQDSTAVVVDSKKALTLEGTHNEKNGGMWTLKHEISSQKFYELIIKK